MNPFLKLRFALLIFGLAIPFSFARADTLMIVSSSEESFGGGKSGLAMEQFGAALTEFKIGRQYRRVVKWFENGSPLPLKNWANLVITSQQPGEKIDLYVLAHTSSSVLPNLSPEESETLFPAGMIRRYFSSGCSNWGKFSESRDGQEVRFKKDPVFNEHLEKLGIQEYVIHANDNGNGPIEFFALPTQIAKSRSWIEAGLRGFDDTNRIMMKALPEIQSLRGPYKMFGTLLGDSDMKIESDLTDFFESLPVLGGTQITQYSHLFGPRNLTPESPEEVLLAPPPTAGVLLERYLPTIYGRSADANKPKAEATLKDFGKGLTLAADIIHDIFNLYGGAGNGCLPPQVIQPIANTLLVDLKDQVPEVRKFCFEKQSGHEYTLRWEFSPSPQKVAGNTKASRIWKIKLPEGFEQSDELTIKNIRLDRLGHLKIVRVGAESAIRIEGIGIQAAPFEILDGVKIPEPLMRLWLKGIRFNEAGEYSVQVDTGLPGLSLDIGGKLKKATQTLDWFKIFGIKIDAK